MGSEPSQQRFELAQGSHRAIKECKVVIEYQRETWVKEKNLIQSTIRNLILRRSSENE